MNLSCVVCIHTSDNPVPSVQVPDFKPYFRSFTLPMTEQSSFRVFSFMMDCNDNVVLRTKSQATDTLWSAAVTVCPSEMVLPNVALFTSDFKVSVWVALNG
jgi:hypothetical protein